jgi:hypothetical protein
MVSAATALRRLRMLFIELPLLLKNDAVQLQPDPSNRAILLGQIQPLVKIVGVSKHFPRLLEPNAPLRIRS